MEKLSNALCWYQKRIGSYDKVLWEQSVEENVLKSIFEVPKRSAKVKSQFIDVDLVRGSTFLKAKPQHGWIDILCKGIIRVILLPIYFKWWRRHTSKHVAVLLLTLYLLQVTTTFVFITDPAEGVPSDEVLPVFHVLGPWLLMMVLGHLHALMVTTFQSQQKRSAMRAKRDHRRKNKVASQAQQRQYCQPKFKGRSKPRSRNQRSSTPGLSGNHKAGSRREDLEAKQVHLADDEGGETSDVSITPPGTIRHSTATAPPVYHPHNKDSDAECELSAQQDVPNDFSEVTGTLMNVEDLSNTSDNGLLSKPDLCNKDNPTIGVGKVTQSESISIAAEQEFLGVRNRMMTGGYQAIDPRVTAGRYSMHGGNAVMGEARYSTGYTELHYRQGDTSSDTADRSAHARNRTRVTVGRDTDNISSCESESNDHLSKSESQAQLVGSSDSELRMMSEATSSVTSDGSSSTVSEDDDDEGIDDNADGGWDSQSNNPNHALGIGWSNSSRVTCMIWEGDEVKKADLSLLDISWAIIQRVDYMSEPSEYVRLAVAFAVIAMSLPLAFRCYFAGNKLDQPLDLMCLHHICTLLATTFGTNWRVIVVVMNGVIQRFFLCLVFFFLLSVAERTFKQRLLYAKHFCYLTSSRRARKYDLPHFRLNKVRNIKTWLSLRAYLKKRGPQRSVDMIVSAAFVLAVIIISLISIELLKNSESFANTLWNWEVTIWCLGVGVFLLRFITLGTKINKKYRNFSVLITEQINLYLHMEQKPHKKDELSLANNVLKLAEDLIKELESPFKVSGLAANPFLYNITKVVILSAFSAVLTELLGFKLKLHKIKIRA